MPVKRLDLEGKIFGRLTVLKFSEIRKGDSFWLCKCECGNECTIRGRNLKKGYTKSCGCYQKFVISTNSKLRKISTLPGETGFNQLYLGYKNGAKQRDIDFNLTKEEFKEIVIGRCNYCGIINSNISIVKSKVKSTGENSKFLYNGIDRVDSNLGYSIDNCVSCCSNCNYAKKSMTTIEFYNWINRVYNYINFKK